MAQCQNGAPPMFFPITNVTVTLDQEAFSRGISISIGTPPQVVSLRLGTADDDLYPVNRAACKPSFNDTCIGELGGVFNPSASTTFREVSAGQWNGTSEANPDQLSEVFFNDVLTFGNATAYGFPAFFDQQNYGGQGTLPLGWNSDFLRIAFAMGAIPSKAYAIWTGSRSIENPVDGSLVVGGYDATRYSGTPTTFHSNDDCTTCAVVTGLTYDTDDSSVSLFSNASETLQIGLSPGEKVLYLTLDMFANFANATGGLWDEDLGNLVYPATNAPAGNLTVTLSNNYKTTISAEDYFAYPRGYNPQGQYEVTNNTIVLAQILPMNKTLDYVFDWGIPYLTMNYLMVDYARNQFQMAPAIRTNFQSEGGGYELEAVCDPSLPASTTHSRPTSSHTSGATASPTSTPVHHSSNNNNTGAIVGGVVGGVLGLILILGILAFLFYRSRQRRRAPPPPAEVGGPVGGPHPQSPHSEKALPAERFSQYTAASPTDVGELSSEKRMGNSSVNEWLSSHGSETATSRNMDRPFEMPAGPYADVE